MFVVLTPRANYRLLDKRPTESVEIQADRPNSTPPTNCSVNNECSNLVHQAATRIAGTYTAITFSPSDLCLKTAHFHPHNSVGFTAHCDRTARRQTFGTSDRRSLVSPRRSTRSSSRRVIRGDFAVILPPP